MNIIDNIPAIVQEVIHAVYNQSYVDLNAYTLSGFKNFMQTNTQVAAISTVLSQVGLVLCVVFVAIIAFVILQRRALKTQKEESDTAAAQPAGSVAPTGVLRQQWSALVAHLDSPHESDWKVAVIEADKLVDDALARAGFSGETFGDRLSNIQPGTLLSLDGVWWAHKIRNRIAHEADYFLRYTEARQAVGYYEAALTELQLI
jgi:hypothetical protein